MATETLSPEHDLTPRCGKLSYITEMTFFLDPIM